MKMRPPSLSRTGAAPRSILGRLLLPFSMVIGAIALFVFLYFPAAMQDREISALLEKGRSIAAMAAFNAEAAVAFSDPQEVRGALSGVFETPEVMRVDVRESDGTHLARVYNEEGAGESEAGPDSEGVIDVLSVKAPVLFRGSPIGEVEVFLTQDILREEVARIRTIVGLLSLAIFLSGVGILAILSAFITRPLGGIVEVAKAVSAGDLERRAPVSTRDEVGVLAEAFNDMVSKLHSSQRELEEINRDLENRVAERTAALMESEERFQQVRKMEAVGRLAGGVAHEFNNLLGVITGYVDLLLLEKKKENGDLTELEAVKTATDRAADLTRQLLAFGRRQLLRPQSIDPNGLVSGAVEMVSRVVGEHIRVEASLDANVGNIEADPGQLERALLNLALNARDGMPKGGVLTLETLSADETRAMEAWGVTLPKARYFVLLVRDDGDGIPEDDLPMVFEPFFRTMEYGDGSGLGLAMVEGIVSQSGGFLFIDSELGKGTEVRLFFPEHSVAPKATPLGEEEGAHAPSAQDAETILVVEDEELVRSMTCAILERVGYRVLSAPGASEAIWILKTHAASIDMVLTDLIMPGLTGAELAKRVRAIDPEIGILFMSGHGGSALDEVAKSEIPLLGKPFTADSLTRLVREILDKRMDLAGGSLPSFREIEVF